MHVQIIEQTIFNFLILGKSRFPPKKFYNINYRLGNLLRAVILSTVGNFIKDPKIKDDKSYVL